MLWHARGVVDRVGRPEYVEALIRSASLRSIETSTTWLVGSGSMERRPRWTWEYLLLTGRRS